MTHLAFYNCHHSLGTKNPAFYHQYLPSDLGFLPKTQVFILTGMTWYVTFASSGQFSLGYAWKHTTLSGNFDLVSVGLTQYGALFGLPMVLILDG